MATLEHMARDPNKRSEVSQVFYRILSREWSAELKVKVARDCREDGADLHFIQGSRVVEEVMEALLDISRCAGRDYDPKAGRERYESQFMASQPETHRERRRHHIPKRTNDAGFVIQGVPIVCVVVPFPLVFRLFYIWDLIR